MTKEKKLDKDSGISSKLPKTVKALLIGLAIVAIVAITIQIAFANPAEKSFSQIDDNLNSLGTERICSNGDGGKGIGNTTPWYEVYYSYNEKDSIYTKLANIIEKDEFIISRDANRLQESKDFQINGDMYKPESLDVLIADRDNEELVAYVFSNAEVPLRCNEYEWGELKSTGDGVILNISLRIND